MAFLQDVSPEEMNEAIALLAEDGAMLSLTVRYQGRWITFRTRAIASKGATFWVDMPRTDHLPTPYEFRRGEPVGVAFSAAHRKYVFQAKVIGSEAYRLEENVSAIALKLRCFGNMHKVERRLHVRLDPAMDEGARATIWLGGQEARPEKETVVAPVWAGRILNISDGGLMIRTSYEAAKYVEVGDIVGLHVMFDAQRDPASVDAQVRHSAPDGEMALIGLQFVESEETPENTVGIERIRQRISQLRVRGRQHQAVT
jgi:hypothetical protein